LRADDHRVEALDLYRTSAGPLDPEDMAAAQTLANVAAAYLLNAQARVKLKASTERSRLIALHDTLTGLPNRTLLLDRMGHAMSRCRRYGKMIGILFTDLDSFKAVNDTYGHHAGDASSRWRSSTVGLDPSTALTKRDSGLDRAVHEGSPRSARGRVDLDCGVTDPGGTRSGERSPRRPGA